MTAESNTTPYDNTADPWTFTGDAPELEEQIEQALARFELLPENFAGQFYRFHHALQNGTELPVPLADAAHRWSSSRPYTTPPRPASPSTYQPTSLPITC